MLCHRHTTSKLASFEDLQTINTLGFRGEALCSISFVSNLSVTTMTEGSLHGYRVNYKVGRERVCVACARRFLIKAALHLGATACIGGGVQVLAWALALIVSQKSSHDWQLTACFCVFFSMLLCHTQKHTGQRDATPWTKARGSCEGHHHQCGGLVLQRSHTPKGMGDMRGCVLCVLDLCCEGHHHQHGFFVLQRAHAAQGVLCSQSALFEAATLQYWLKAK